MSLPKNDQNLSKEEYDKLWGPETSVDGFWDRDDIYDNLQSSGWNKEGDEKIIAAFWKIGARDDFNTLIPASLYENRVTTDKERADLIREVLEYAETKDLDLTGLEEEVKSLQEERKALEERIAQEARRQEAERKAQEEAQREQRVREEAERQRRAEERRIQREKEAQELREKMEREKQAESEREQRRLEEAENQRLWDKWAEGHDNIYYGREWWEQKKAEMLEDERQQREGIGKYSKEAMEKAQREHDEEVRKEEEERQRQKEIEEERAKAEEARSNQVMAGLTGIEKELREKGPEHVADVGAWSLGNWLDRNGYDMLDNSFLVKNGVESKLVNGEVVKTFNMDGELEIPEVDRDIWSGEEYRALIEKAQKTKQLYQENRDAFQEAFNVMYRSRHGMGIMLMDVHDEMERINKNKELLGKLNQFRHNLYEVKLQDENVCKLMNKDKQPVLVEPLKEDVAFDKAMREKEIKILETCYDMLREPSMRVKRNSSEYASIMKSIANVKKVLREEPDNEKAKAAYIKTVNKVLNNINRYRVHKAKDGVNEHDATYDKIIAMERVDKLLRTRYQSLEQREYEDSIGAVADLFKVEVKDPNKSGDEYVFEKAMGKIGNMKKQIEDYHAEIEQERAMEKRSNSIGGIIHDDIVRSILEGEPKAKEEAVRQAAPKKKAGGIREKFGFDEAVEKKGAKKLAEDALEAGKGKKLADKLLADRDQQIAMNLSNNEMMKAVNEKEQKYRDGLNLKDETDKSRYMNSVAKTLYEECLLQVSIKKGIATNETVGREVLEKGLTALNKSAIKARAFMAEHLTDKDFNKEFGSRVLAGAAKGKTSHADIVKFRDEALTACYQNYKGKDTKKLDELAAILGSQVNSGKLTKQTEKKAEEPGKKAPKKEVPKNELPGKGGLKV